MKNFKKNLTYYFIGCLFLIAGLVILFITNPFSTQKENDTSLNIGTKPAISEILKSNNGMKLIKENHIDTTLYDLSYNYVNNMFNIGYRNLISDKTAYIDNISRNTKDVFYIMNNPDTKKLYDFDKKGTYTKDELNEFIVNFIINNKVESSAKFVPKTQTTITEGYLYYVGGDLEITFYECENLENFAKYFQIENMKLNKKYTIPIEVEVFKDYIEGYKIGQIYREFEFLELWEK